MINRDIETPSSKVTTEESNSCHECKDGLFIGKVITSYYAYSKTYEYCVLTTMPTSQPLIDTNSF